jgi:hypothetical protein
MGNGKANGKGNENGKDKALVSDILTFVVLNRDILT